MPTEGLIITKHGEPVALLTPIKPSGSIMELYGSMKNEVKVYGDIMSTGERWNADS